MGKQDTIRTVEMNINLCRKCMNHCQHQVVSSSFVGKNRVVKPEDAKDAFDWWLDRGVVLCYDKNNRLHGYVYYNHPEMSVKYQLERLECPFIKEHMSFRKSKKNEK